MKFGSYSADSKPQCGYLLRRQRVTSTSTCVGVTSTYDIDTCLGQCDVDESLCAKVLYLLVLLFAVAECCVANRQWQGKSNARWANLLYTDERWSWSRCCPYTRTCTAKNCVEWDQLLRNIKKYSNRMVQNWCIPHYMYVYKVWFTWTWPRRVFAFRQTFSDHVPTIFARKASYYKLTNSEEIWIDCWYLMLHGSADA